MPLFAASLRLLDLSGNLLASIPQLVLHCSSLQHLELNSQQLNASCLAAAGGGQSGDRAPAGGAAGSGSRGGRAASSPLGAAAPGSASPQTPSKLDAAAGTGQACSSGAGGSASAVQAGVGAGAAGAVSAAQLPQLLPRLRRLRVHGNSFDIRAVEALMCMARALGAGRSQLEVELVQPPP